MKQIMEQADKGRKHSKVKIPVAEWLPVYGTDSCYASRRIRRITERAYYKASV